jgi:L-rhamnose isomerase / sugar isomerase
VFQDDDYRLGSVCNPDPKVRKKALAHLLECVGIMDATSSQDLKLWFADGTNYPGQDDIVARQDRLAEALAAVYARLGPGQRLLLEYKLFEPAFYTTDVPDWGTSLLHCQALGDRARVVVDTGHHAPGVNIEFIVALLLKVGRLGGFDFNSRFYADDDLMVGAADPFQLFRIMHEVAKAGALAPEAGVAFMLDQCRHSTTRLRVAGSISVNGRSCWQMPASHPMASRTPGRAPCPFIRCAMVSTARAQLGPLSPNWYRMPGT